MKFTDIIKRARGDAPVNRVAGLVQAQGRVIAELNTRLKRIEAQLARTEAQLSALNGSAGIPQQRAGEAIREIDPEAWATVAQAGELSFHKRPNMRSSASWEDDIARDWMELGFEADAWAGKLIIDVGAGSRLRTLYFKGAKIAALEPLADKFAAEVEWQDIDKADEMYPTPVEKLVPELVGRGDLIVSINALDHGFDFETGIANIRQYAKPEATVFLSFDQHEKPDNMHPLVLNDGIVRDIFERNGFEVVKCTPRRRYHGAAGPGALNYWLRPV